MKKIIFILVFLFAAKAAHCALPPFYQSLKEIDTILSDDRLSKEIGSAEPITNIKKVKTGYIIATVNYQVKVDVNYLPQQRPGPAKFDLKFNDKTRYFGSVPPYLNNENYNGSNSIKTQF